MCTRAYRFSGEHPAFPAQWLYGLYEIVLVTLLFVTPSPCEALASSRVDACIGASDPNDFTVRCNPFVSRAAASTAACPSFATMANAPLVGQDGGSRKSDLPDGGRRIFFVAGLDGWNRDEIAGEISLYAHTLPLSPRSRIYPTSTNLDA